MTRPEIPDAGAVYCSEGVEILGDAELLAEGWTRRSVTDPARVAEMIELYRELGFETTTSAVDPETFGAACTSCALEACAAYVAIYTRKTRRPGGARAR